MLRRAAIFRALLICSFSLAAVATRETAVPQRPTASGTPTPRPSPKQLRNTLTLGTGIEVEGLIVEAEVGPSG